MATQAELKDQESGCNDAASYAALAMKALAEPADADYAKALLAKGEMSCSFPVDYLRIAEGWAAAGDKDKAASLYEEAENTCFEPKEKAEVGYSIALHMGDKDKGRALLEEAIASTNNTTELLSYAGYVQQALQDNALTNKLFGKVTGGCKTIADFQKLANDLQTQGNTDAARMVFAKASPSSNDTADVVTYAGGLNTLFGDKAEVESTLAGAESSCMFPGQFVTLAGGFLNLLGNREKAEALLEQGKEFAMSGDENLDLANGYASLLGDQATASGMYNEALSSFGTKDELLKLANAVATHMDDKAIAGKAYDKLASKLSTPADLSMLAQAVNDNLGDKDRVAALYAAAESKATNTAALVALAGEVRKTLADDSKVNAIYSKALEQCKVYTDSSSILDALSKNPADANLTGSALQKALELTDTNAQVLDVAQRAQKLLPDDNSVILQALDKAEANISSLDEMRKLATAAKQLVAGDAERNTRIGEKLTKREASQALYVEFQNREKTFTRSSQFIDLAQEAVDKLDDASYAAQLLATAEEKLQGESFSFSRYQPLIVAVGNLAKDNAWLTRLLDLAATNSQNFAQVRNLGETVSQRLNDTDFGKSWTKTFYTNQLAKLDNSGASTFEYNKLAKAIKEHTGDAAWAEQVLEKATERAANHFHYAYSAELAQSWGNTTKAEGLYAKAAEACQDSAQQRELAELMRKAGVAVSTKLNAPQSAQTSGKGIYW